MDKIFFYKKYLLIFLFLLIIISSSFLEVMAQSILEEVELDIETSIVLLTMTDGSKEISSDPFFEMLIFPEKDYYLLPVTLLNPYLEMEMNLIRENGKLSLISSELKRSVEIDLKNKKYLGHAEWEDFPPLIYNGDFYIAPEVFSYLFDISISWDPGYQELLLEGDYFFSDGEKNFEEGLSDNLYKDEEEKNFDKEKIIRGSDFSLGSIHYLIKADYRARENYNDTLFLPENINLYSHYKDWYISLGLDSKQKIFQKENEIEINSIKAGFEDEDKIIIIGDSDMDFSETIGENDLRGIYYDKSSNNNKFMAYTSLSGQAERGAEVSLFINGDKYFTEILKKDEYSFDFIPLNIYRLNKLKIVIKNRQGEVIDEIKKEIAASPRLYKKDTKNFTTATGLYKKQSLDYWEGKMIGLETVYSPTDNLSFEFETVFLNKKEKKEMIVTGGDYGIALRAGKNMVFTFDWLVSGEDKIFHNGAESTLLYSMKSGHIMGILFYVPEKVAENIQYSEGKGLNLFSLFDLNKNWSFSPNLNYFETLEEDNIYVKREGEVSLIYVKGWQREDEFRVSIANITSFYESPYNAINYLGENTRYGLSYSASRYNKGFKMKGELGLFENNIYLENDLNWDYFDYYLKGNIYKKLFSSILITNELKSSGNIFDGEINTMDIENKTSLKINFFKNLSLTLKNKTIDLESEEIKELINSLNLNYYLNRGYIDFEVSKTENETEADYYNYNINFGYFPQKRDELYSIYLTYNDPIEDLFADQLQYGLNYNLNFANERELNLNIGKNYLSFLRDDYEYFVVVSLSHALGFVDGLRIPQRFNNSHHRSFITGLVYLDENNNGLFDQGEKKIPGIKMRLDNMLGITDENGRYKIKFNFPGIYSLNFDYNSLEADYTPVTDEKIVEIRKNENMAIDFGLTINGSISGKIFIDENVNGIFDKGELPLQWVGIKLDGKQTRYTDKRGEYYFGNIPLGEHSITILEKSLPSDMVSKNGDKFEFKITLEKLDIEEIFFPLKYDF